MTLKQKAPRYKCQRKFNRLDELNRLVDAKGDEGAAASKAKRSMNDSNTKGKQGPLGSFWNPNNKSFAGW